MTWLSPSLTSSGTATRRGTVPQQLRVVSKHALKLTSSTLN